MLGGMTKHLYHSVFQMYHSFTEYEAFLIFTHMQIFFSLQVVLCHVQLLLDLLFLAFTGFTFAPQHASRSRSRSV